MSAASTTHKSTTKKQSPKNGLTLAWLDDSAGEDSEAKTILLSLFEQVFCFTEPLACFELVESAEGEPSCLCILVSGRYGQMYVQNRFQPLNQVKYIYVYCMDLVKHKQWAQLCDKVRWVDSDFGKILQHMHQDVMKPIKENTHHHHPQHQEHQQPMDVEHPQEPEPEPSQEELTSKPPERFKDDNNMYDELAHCILLQQSADDDGADDFKKYCQTYKTTADEGTEHPYFQADLPLEKWYKPDLFYVHLNAMNLPQLWSLRWFIRIFYKQLIAKHDHFIRNQSKFTVYYGTWVTTNEFDKIKQRVGKFMICNELLLAHTSKQEAVNSLGSKINEQTKHKIIFEINVDTFTQMTIPYGEVDKDTLLFWFGSRHRLVKIEFVDGNDSYWLVGLKLSPTLNSNQLTQTLYDYYCKSLTELNDIHYALGKILIYKGLYYQAEKWFENTTHYEELAEVTIRQHLCEQACQYLEHVPEDSDNGNLLRAYVNLLVSNDNITKGRTLLMRIGNETTDKILRARVNIALGFINLIVSQQIDQALEHFTLGYDTLRKNLPEIHPDIAKSLIGIGYAHFAKHNIGDAEKAFRTALQIQNQYLPYHHPDLAKSRIGLAHCLAANPQTMKEALQELGVATNILIRTFRRNFKSHPQVLLTRNEIERVQKGKELRARNILLDYI